MPENNDSFSISEFLSNLCLRIQEAWNKAFGKPENSSAATKLLPASTKWVLMLNCSFASQVFIVNKDADNAIEFALKDDWDVGEYIPAGDGRALDNVRGAIFARVVDPTKTAYCNVIGLGLWSD